MSEDDQIFSLGDMKVGRHMGFTDGLNILNPLKNDKE